MGARVDCSIRPITTVDRIGATAAGQFVVCCITNDRISARPSDRILDGGPYGNLDVRRQSTDIGKRAGVEVDQAGPSPIETRATEADRAARIINQTPRHVQFRAARAV